MAGNVKIGDTPIPEGVILLPVEKVSETVSLSPKSQLAGIRFQPAIGYGLIGHFRLTKTLPGPLKQALDSFNETTTPGALNEQIGVSQRHVERLFKHWMEMTPKQYQRILRVKRAIDYIREHSRANLAEVAHQFGFSDQAHMTREFRAIARITPGKV
ncbi:hypothetical protein BEE62_09030 [Marinobacter nauticus]|uniref:HTH araC/xylS-type domain-containing protein n=1 Tax=Marinobacter nauticus TaxID=2743 RepID=A0A1M2V1K5_MARNT|nr:hypothetical protein BEE62_09030 [Marinobacter nauticus]